MPASPWRGLGLQAWLRPASASPFHGFGRVGLSLPSLSWETLTGPGVLIPTSQA